jgi:hypothetical protein
MAGAKRQAAATIQPLVCSGGSNLLQDASSLESCKLVAEVAKFMCKHYIFPASIQINQARRGAQDGTEKQAQHLCVLAAPHYLGLEFA